MKKAGTWVLNILGKALILILVIVALPYAFRLAENVFPDLTGRIQNQTAVLMRELQGSKRLETAKIIEEGILQSDTDVILLGTVGKTTISYRYEGSMGIDLAKVELKRSGKKLTFLLPAPEMLSDRIEALDVTRNDFLSHAIDKSVEDLMEEQRLKCRAYYLEENEHSEKAWEETKKAFEETIGAWANTFGRENYTFAFERKTSD